MRTFGRDAPSAAGMPSGLMVADGSAGMPTGTMLAGPDTDGWNMDLASPQPPCGCS
jgi:hypothetical protein